MRQGRGTCSPEALQESCVLCDVQLSESSGARGQRELTRTFSKRDPAVGCRMDCEGSLEAGRAVGKLLLLILV